MRVFTCTAFKGHYPVGTAAVIIAEDRIAAMRLFMEALQKAGLTDQNWSEVLRAVMELPLDEPRAVILCNGDY